MAVSRCGVHEDLAWDREKCAAIDGEAPGKLLRTNVSESEAGTDGCGLLGQRSKKTRDAGPTLVQRWAGVCDAGPALNQRGASVSLGLRGFCVDEPVWGEPARWAALWFVTSPRLYSAGHTAARVCGWITDFMPS